MAKKKETTQHKKKLEEQPKWKTMKSGARKHRNGKWYASLYGTGWYFYTSELDGNLGPYETFEDGLKEWKE